MALFDHLKYRAAGRAFVQRHADEIRAALADGYSSVAIYWAFVADGNPPPIRERQFRTLTRRWRSEQDALSQPSGSVHNDGPAKPAGAESDYETFRRSLDYLDAKTRRERVAERFVHENDNPLFNRQKSNS